MRTGIGEEYRTLIHYFLGELPEGEQEAVEERYMLDEAYAELRDEVEMDLVDAYVGGTLTALERRHFEQHYLVTRERKEGVKAAYLSRVYRERIAPPAARAPSAPGPVFLRERPMIPAMAAAIAVLAIGGASWLIYAWWGGQREIRGVVQTAANPPVRPLGAPQDDGGGKTTTAPSAGRKPATTPAPTHRQDTGGGASASQSAVPATALTGPTTTTTSHPGTTTGAETTTTTGAAAIEKKLESEYQPTKTTDDKSGIVTHDPTTPSTSHPTTAASNPAPSQPEAPSAAPQPAKAPPARIEPKPPPRPNPAEVSEGQTTAQVAACTTTLPAVAYAQGRGAAGIQKTLESAYQLTKTTDDKSDIVTAGSVLVLCKDKVLMVAATSSANPCMNTYKDGKISPTKACGVGEKLRRLPGFGHVPGAGSAPATRNFVSGEKFWVTKIDVRANGVVFDFFTDATPAGDQGVRYKGSLTIPFGALTPTPEEALKVVADVITVAPSEDTKSGDNAQPAPQSSQQAVAPPVNIEIGQTIDHVTSVLGQPVKKAKVGTKDIYYYKDLKVTFVNGMVKDIE